MKRALALIGVYLSTFVNSLMFTVVFPMASQMVMYFEMVTNRSETGYWVGLLGGSIMLGRFLSAPIWGWLCDHWGRRVTMLTGIITTSALAVGFGLSQSFYWALLFRFLQGLLSPITVVARTVISELFPSSEQAHAMSWFILTGSIGNISGNIVGGFFSDPQENGGLLREFPFLLPNLVVALFGVISLALCYFCLEETKPKETVLEGEPKSFMEVIREPAVIWITLLYVMGSITGTAFGELLVLWEWAKVKNGGFEFSTEEIGTLSAITSLAYMLYVKNLYTKMIRKYGMVTVTEKSMIASVPFVLAFPLLSFSRETEYLKYGLLVVAVLIYNTLEFMSITSSLIMINNAVYYQYRGKLNGFTLAVGNLARGFTPPIFGTIFAIAATSGNPYPFNFALSFIVLAFFVAAGWLVSKQLDSSLNLPKGQKQKEEALEQELIAVSMLEEGEKE